MEHPPPNTSTTTSHAVRQAMRCTLHEPCSGSTPYRRPAPGPAYFFGVRGSIFVRAAWSRFNLLNEFLIAHGLSRRSRSRTAGANRQRKSAGARAAMGERAMPVRQWRSITLDHAPAYFFWVAVRFIYARPWARSNYPMSSSRSRPVPLVPVPHRRGGQVEEDREGARAPLS